MRKTAGYTLRDYKTDTEIAKELNIIPVLEKKNTGIQKKLVANTQTESSVTDC